MSAKGSQLSSLLSLLIFMLHSTTQVTAGSQFSSHITVNTPAKSFTHGVGDPIPTGGRRWPQPSRGSFKSLRRSHQSTNQVGGYLRMRPSIPFNDEDRVHRASFHQVAPWVHNNFKEVAIPVLPPSPYKVDSPDPESLWPEGLFVPPHSPPRFGASFGRRADDGEVQSEPDFLDPYLLEGSEAIAAVERSQSHGHLYFHEIPHIDSLLANQELRAKNQLKPHRIASLRHTWPYNRP